MKKSGALVLVLFLATMFLISFASANWFTEAWSKITGKAISGSGSGLIYSEDATTIFDSSSSAKSLGTFNFDDKSFALSIWAKKDSSSMESGRHEFLFGQGSGLGGIYLHMGYYYHIGPGVFVCNFGKTGVSTQSGQSDASWHLWTCSYDYNNKVLSLYKDNVLVAENRNASAGLYSKGSYPLYLGSFPGDCCSQNKFYGSVNSIKVYNRSLSGSEVLELYTSAPSQNQTNVTTATCTDSDGGNLPNVFGIMTYTENNNPSWSRSDECILCSPSNCGGGWYPSNGGSCAANEAGCAVREAYCDSPSSQTTQKHLCPNGCLNGACVITASDYPKCCCGVNPGAGNFTYISNLSQEIQCKTWGNVVSGNITRPSDCSAICVANQKTCNDSDGGLNYFVRGEVRLMGSNDPKTDYCIDSKKLYEFSCSNNKINYTLYNCEWCENGACLTNLNYNCTDSDGGTNYYVKGNTQGIDGVSAAQQFVKMDDFCILEYGPEKKPAISEGYCLNNKVYFNSDYCPNGCVDGACVNATPQVCQELINSIKNPLDSNVSGGEKRVGWKSVYNGTTVVNNKEEKYNRYSASWSWNSKAAPQNNDLDYYYVNYDLEVFDNKAIDLSEYASWNSRDPGCKVSSHYIDGKENIYYICNWNALSNKQDGDLNYKSNNRQIFWYNDNIAVRMYIYWGEELTDAQATKLSEQRLNELINNLQNNGYKYLDWQDFNINWPASNEIYTSIRLCNSDQKGSGLGDWSCKTEPIICPPHGQQTRICNAWNPETQEYETQTSIMGCNPGICSGCMVPVWFGSKWDSKCIPYGFRFEQKEGNKNKITQGDIIEEIITENNMPAVFNINSDGSASVKILRDIDMTNISNGEISSFLFVIDGAEFRGKAGESLVIYPGYHTFDVTYYDSMGKVVYKGREEFNLNRIVYLENNSQSYLEFISEYSYNAYCDIDGWVKQQKSKQYDGEWARCQNNYECDSNICSSGECIELKDIVREVNAFKAGFVKLICRLSNLFSTDGYNQCVYEYLGASSA